MREWAYAQPYPSSARRTRALAPWLRAYNTSAAARRLRLSTPVLPFSEGRAVNNLARNHT